MTVRIDEVEANVREPAPAVRPQGRDGGAPEESPRIDPQALRAALERLAERERRLCAD